jgi:hypothetical protein
VWFAALYGINPTGSQILGGNRAQDSILQKLAWDTLSKEPLSGLGTVPGQPKGYKPLPAGSTAPPPGALPAGFPGYKSKGKGSSPLPKGSSTPVSGKGGKKGLSNPKAPKSAPATVAQPRDSKAAASPLAPLLPNV